MLPVRVFYRKKGVAAYISHLDLQRAVSRAILRSGLSPVYSEGFNPHIKTVFTMPLPLFVESDYEIFDFAIYDILPYEEITRRLQSVFPKPLEIIKSSKPVKKLAAVQFSDYIINFYTKFNPNEISDLLSGKIEIEKKTKKGFSITDISSYIIKKEVENLNGITLRLTLYASSEKYLNPQYIIKFLSSHIEAPIIKRIMIYDENMEEFN